LDNHALVKGNKNLLDDETKKSFIYIKEKDFGFEGITKNKNLAYEIFGDEVVYDKANLEDLLEYYVEAKKHE